MIQSKKRKAAELYESPSYRFEWTSKLLQKIEECASENGVLEIDIPREEYNRLHVSENEEGNPGVLKHLLSENAFKRILVLDEIGGRYYLLVSSMGSCH
jgi:hypothetical protein